MFISFFFLTSNNNNISNLILEYEYFYNSTKEDYREDSYNDGYFEINQTANYKICVYGAKAIKGGRGGEICGINNFNKSDILYYKLGGTEAGGKGGKGCGLKNKNDGYNGAGYGKINYSDNFLIVAGGGGGDSEERLNKGGDAGKNGGGELGGKAGTQSSGGKRGGSNGENGSQYKGGNADSSIFPNTFCGGGGGAGYYGGGSGGYGSKNKNGGGGGGSNFCKANVCLYNETKINEIDYSGVRIYRYKK